MINILFIVPTTNMEKNVKEIFDFHPQKDMLYRNISVITAENIDLDTLEGDIVIARGLTFQKIKNYKPFIPKIELHISALDVINTLRQCINKYASKKIALIGRYSSISNAKPFFKLLDCEIKLYDYDVENISMAFNIALKDGCDAFVGGHSVCQYVKTRNKNYLEIETGKEAILNTINEAIRTYEILEQSKLYETVIQNSKDSILYVDNDFKITLMNSNAVTYMEKLYQNKNFHREHINKVFPFMYNNVRKVFLEKKEISNELHKIGYVQIAATYRSIFVGDRVTGILINFANVEKIQQDEIQIRKKLSFTGLKAKYTFENIIHKSSLMDQIIQQSKKIAKVSSNVLIIGETGTGKELFAQSIHNASPRRNGPFVAVNCAALPENLIESELFGYSRGAFTNAAKEGKAGLIELAHNGTLFLDEISEVPISFQSKLLRVLQENEVRRIGDNKVISVNVRIISALNKNIYQLVNDGLFRSDLLYRLDVLRIKIPPLRLRPEDILELFMYYVNSFNQKMDSFITSITPEAATLLQNYEFQGNVRELKNAAERVCVLNDSKTISYSDMYEVLYNKNIEIDYTLSVPTKSSTKTIDNDERKTIEDALIKADYNKKKAAELLKINRSTLWRKMKKLNIEVQNN